MASELRWRWTSGALGLLLALPVLAEGTVHLKSRTIHSLAGGRIGKHYLLQFGSYPDAGVRAELATRGVRVLSYVPDSTLMVSSETVPNMDGLGVLSAGSLAASDKLSPELADSGRAGFLVMLYPDVPAAKGRELISRHGYVMVHSVGLLPGHFVVAGPSANLADLAAEDEVSYILPASPGLLSGAPLLACAGAVTEAGVVAQYVEATQGWPESPSGDVELNYAFESFTPKLDENAIRSEVSRALAEWARYANLNFSEGSDPFAARTIDVKFASGPHGDAYPFDGPGGMLAHTFYPAPTNSEPIAGDMHLDADENWQIGSDVDLFSVALHEAGHALGLGHSDNPDSVMYPYYRVLAGLSTDDIAGIRALYGSNNPTPAAPEPIDPTVTTGTTPVTTSAPPTATSSTPPMFTPPFTTPTSPSSIPTSPATTPPTQPVTPPAGAPPATSDTTPPSLKITSPGTTILSTAAASFTITGTASDNVAVASVQWTTSNGAFGTASGTTNWSAQVPLLVGDNTVIVRAYDASGNSAWRALTVVRQ